MNELEIKTEFENIEDKSIKITTIEEKKYDFSLIYNFSVGLAEKYGLNESIMLNNLIFWTKTNQANEKNFYDGYFWTFNSARAYKELFPFWTERQIRYILESLEKQGLIKSGNYNKLKYDHTKWYAIIDKSILQICNIRVTELSDQSDKNVRPIPDINTDKKQDNKYESFSNKKYYFKNKNTWKEVVIEYEKFYECFTKKKILWSPMEFKYLKEICNRLNNHFDNANLCFAEIFGSLGCEQEFCDHWRYKKGLPVPSLIQKDLNDFIKIEVKNES